MHPRIYKELLNNLSKWFPYLDLTSIEKLSLAKRSAIVTLARSRICGFDPNLKLIKQLREKLSAEEIKKYIPFNDDPFTSALLRNLALWAPYDLDEYKQLKKQCVDKEIKIHQRLRKPPQINYAPFFGSYQTPIHPDLPANPEMARYVHSCITKWEREMDGLTLFPKLSNKSMSASTTAAINEHFCRTGSHFPLSEISKFEMEYFWHTEDEPFFPDGICEMRQRHYMGYVKPRTYFSIGGTVHAQTRFASKPMSKLADSSVVSHQITSLLPSRITIDPDETVLIYDLTGFTSNLDEHEYFLRDLAKNMRCGSVVTVVDPVQGPHPVLLSDLVESLADAHHDVPFSTHRVDWQNDPLFSGPGGFLGIGGNIQSARFLHGAIVQQTCKNANKVNSAGDDGVVATSRVEDTKLAISLLGILADEKVFDPSEPGAIALKRPCYTVGEGLVLGFQLALPNFEMMSDRDDLDDRYPLFAAKTIRERRCAAAGSLLSSLQSFDLVETAYQEEYLKLCRLFYQLSGLPLDGNIPQLREDPSMGVVPPIAALGQKDPISTTIRMLYRGTAKLPVRGIKSRVQLQGDIHETCEGNWDARLSYLETLKYVIQEPIYEIVSGDDGLQRLLGEFNDPPPAVVTVIVIQKFSTLAHDVMATK